MSRLTYLKENVSFSKLIKHYEYRDCDEFIVDRWGDVCVFRVYGDNEDNFKIFEK